MRAWRIALLALEGLRRTPLRVGLTALGVAIASSALVTMVAFALGLERQIETPVKMLSLLSDIQVSRKEEPASSKVPPLDDVAVERLAQLPGVAAAFPNIRSREIKIRCGNRSESCQALSAPREMAVLGVADNILVAGRFFDGGPEPEAILGAPLARRLGFAMPQQAIGARLELEAAGLAPQAGNSLTLAHRKLEVTVVGVYELPPLLPKAARSSLLLPVDLMRGLPGTQVDSALARLKVGGDAKHAGYSSVTVRVREPRDLGAVDERIKGLGYQTKTSLSRFNELQTFFILLEVLLATIGTVALIIAALGVVNTLLMAVLERYQEIGICKALGASDGDLVVLFLTEAALIGLLGGLGGLVLGRVVSFGLDTGLDIYARRQGATSPLDLFAFPPWLLAGTVLFAVVVSLLAGVYPALRAARADPIQTLRRG